MKDFMTELQRKTDELAALAGLPPIRSIDIQDLDEGFTINVKTI